MGLLGLLASPITGPLRAWWWVLERIVGAAEAELYDEDRILGQLRALTLELERRRITEREHAAAERVLLARLSEARARRAMQDEVTW